MTQTAPKSAEARKAARRAGLRYVSDDQVAGITRHGKPGQFFYKSPSGNRVRDARILGRIRKLAIPPAWTDVWVAPFENAHLVATGRDARGRKQYRYHNDFAAVRDRDKYGHLIQFAQCLPKLRRQLASDMRKPGLPREKVVAVVINLLEATRIRVGNEDYARDNGSFGLTTLRNRHVKVNGGALRFTFRGKSGKDWQLSIRDRRIAKVVGSCQELPGQHLFGYRDDAGKVQSITSTDVNAYLHDVCGDDISAKDFRTWSGTVEAALAFAALSDKTPTKKNVNDVVGVVAERLGNTMAVCRKCYIHPAIFIAFERGKLKLGKTRSRGAVERSVLAMLRRG